MRRREFIKRSMGAATLLPLGYRLASADQARSSLKPQHPVLVFVFLQGGADLLSVLPPIEDPAYAKLRPNIAHSRARGTTEKLDGPFCLHPGAGKLLPLWKNKNLSFVLQTGFSEPLRSHFQCSDALEFGGSGVTSGFLTRALARSGQGGGLRAIAIQNTMPGSLIGADDNALSFPSLRLLHALKAAPGYDLKKLPGAISDIMKLEPLTRGLEGFKSAFPRSAFGGAMAEIAWLIRSEQKIPIYVTGYPDWDLHAQQGAEEGRAAELLRDFSASLFSFSESLAADWERTLVVVMTEFGRTAAENGSLGTDHGRGSFTLLAGGGVRGGKLHGEWKDLKPENLFEGRDIPVTTDHRQILTEVLSEHLRIPEAEKIFPGFSYSPARRLHLLSRV